MSGKDASGELASASTTAGWESMQPRKIICQIDRTNGHFSSMTIPPVDPFFSFESILDLRIVLRGNAEDDSKEAMEDVRQRAEALKRKLNLEVSRVLQEQSRSGGFTTCQSSSSGRLRFLFHEDESSLFNFSLE